MANGQKSLGRTFLGFVPLVAHQAMIAWMLVRLDIPEAIPIPQH
jgi:hypothetical protein